MLDKVDEPLWLAEGEIVSFHGFPYPTRSVIIRLTDYRLWVWSPVRLTEELRRKVDRLGQVGHLVSPNKPHHLGLAAWSSVYPAAKLWGSALDRHALSGSCFRLWSGVRTSTRPGFGART
jgi:hypothetical protein